MDVRSPAVFGRTAGLHGLTDFSLRRLVAWGDHLKVDHPQIDAQHEAIFHIATEIADVWHCHGQLAEIQALAQKLHKVLWVHCKFEESQLEAVGYPNLAEHRREHKIMLKELELIRKRLEQMDAGLVQGEPGFVVLNYILGVTVGHIFQSDMEYCTFAREKAKQGAQVWPVA